MAPILWKSYFFWAVWLFVIAVNAQNRRGGAGLEIIPISPGCTGGISVSVLFISSSLLVIVDNFPRPSTSAAQAGNGRFEHCAGRLRYCVSLLREPGRTGSTDFRSLPGSGLPWAELAARPVRFDERDVETEHGPDSEAPAAERAGNR